MGVHMLKKEGGPVFQTREEAEEADHVRWEKTEGGLDIIERANFLPTLGTTRSKPELLNAADWIMRKSWRYVNFEL